MSRDPSIDVGRGVSRRGLLLGGAVAGLGAAAAIGGDHLLNSPAERSSTAGDCAVTGQDSVPFHGVHQAGVETPPPAHATFIALTLHPDADREALRRLMRILTDDAVRLSQGRPALADSEPELAAVPARLTVTFGFGPELVLRAAGGSALPGWLGPLPGFAVDRLDPAFCGGDLLLQIGADDPLTVAHAARMLLKDARGFADVRWIQNGFRRARGSEASGSTARNLFGQVDGTVNPAPGSADFDRLVWAAGGWLGGGTGIVVRRISMELDKWDRLDRAGREQAVGRYLSSGAPLTGRLEGDEPDFDAVTAAGFPVIPEFSHLRRARSDNPDERIYRRGYNYDDAPGGGSVSNSGLIFVSYQADVARQFVPLQRRLDELDLLNSWTTPIGSAVFAIPPGCGPGGFIGETLLA